MLFLFKMLPEGIRSGDDLAIVYFKLLLWIFVFAVMYTGAKKVFHDQNRVAVMLALVLSLTTVIMISNSFVKTIFELYAGLISVLLALLPLLVILYFNKKIFPEKNAWSGWAKGLVFIFAAMVVLFLSVSIAESTSVDIYLDLAGWMEIAAVVLLFMGIIMFFWGASGMVKGDYQKGNVKGMNPNTDLSKGKEDVSNVDKDIENLNELDKRIKEEIRELDSKTKILDSERTELKRKINELIKEYSNFYARYTAFLATYQRGDFTDNAKAKKSLGAYENKLKGIEASLVSLAEKLGEEDRGEINEILKTTKKDIERNSVLNKEIQSEAREIAHYEEELKKLEEEKQRAKGRRDNKKVKDIERRIESVKGNLNAKRAVIKRDSKKRGKVQEAIEKEKIAIRELSEEERDADKLVGGLKNLERTNDRVGKDKLIGWLYYVVRDNTKTDKFIKGSVNAFMELHNEISNLDSSEDSYFKNVRKSAVEWERKYRTEGWAPG